MKIGVYFIFFILCLPLAACEFKCGISNCDFIGKTENNLRSHRFTHTNQRPYCCSGCGYSGFARQVTWHLKTQCKDARSQKTLLTPETKTIIDWCAKPKAPQHYRCGIDRCMSKSSSLSKIKKHRRKKHIDQKKYTCSLCNEQYNAKDGKRHIPACVNVYKRNGQLLRNKLFSTARALLACPVYGYYADGSCKMLENLINDDTYSIEYLPDSEEELPQLPANLSFEDLLAINSIENSEESLLGSS